MAKPLPPTPSPSPEPDPNLARQLDRALKDLPSVAAPPSLARNVRALLEARARRPWWQRAWWEWPLAARATFAALAVLAGAALSSGSFLVGEGAESYSQSLLQQFTSPAPAMDLAHFDSLADAASLVWDRAARPLLTIAGGIALALYLTCIGLGTACFRLLQRRS